MLSVSLFEVLVCCSGESLSKLDELGMMLLIRTHPNHSFKDGRPSGGLTRGES